MTPLVQLALILLFGLATASLAMNAMDLWAKIREGMMRRAFHRAFREWDNEADWRGYSEVPDSMYEDLVRRLVAAGEEKP